MGSLFKSPKPPAPLNVESTAKASNKQNLRNAQLQATFNRPDQTDAAGNSITYKQTGKDRYGNPTYAVKQQLGATGKQFQQGFSQLGQDYFAGASNLMNNPADYSNQATENRLVDLGSRRLDPRFQQEENALRQRLANQGLDPTSEAFASQFKQFGENKNDAYNQLYLQGRGQAFNEAVTGRQQQVGELQSLAAPGLNYGSSVVNPNPVAVPQVGVQNTDIAALQMANQQGLMQNYQAKQQQQQAMLGGLASIGGSILSAPMTGGASLAGSFGKSLFG
jgi:hypothetical protein